MTLKDDTRIRYLRRGAGSGLLLAQGRAIIARGRGQQTSSRHGAPDAADVVAAEVFEVRSRAAGRVPPLTWLLLVTGIYDRPAGTKPGLWDRVLPIFGQGPDERALPVLYAITEDLPSGTFTGPEHLFHMRGGAEIIKPSAAAKEPMLQADLWAASEDMTRVAAAR